MVDRKKKDTAVLIIGLGRFGAATAGQLARLDREVMAVDEDMELVQKWADRITHTVQADVTKIEALEQIGARDFPTAVVAVGSSIEASVLITANLVDLGIKEIWAKAISKSHGQILTRIGATHVIYPEAEAGERVAHLLSGQMLDFVELDADFAIVKMYPPLAIQNKSLAQAGARRDYKITVVGVKKPGGSFTYSTGDTFIEPADQIIVSGHPDDIEKFASLEK